MSLDKLNKADLLAAAKELQSQNEALEEENKALTQAIEELQNANKKATSASNTKAPIVTIGGEQYYFKLKTVRTPDGVKTAEEIAENPEKYEGLLKKLLGKKANYLQPVK